MPGNDGDPRANDGASWIMEGNRNRQYHVVERQSPKDTDYGKVGVYLIKISGATVDESRDELYERRVPPNNSFNRIGISLHVIRQIEGLAGCFPPG